MTAPFALLKVHGVPQKHVELLEHWFETFPGAVDDPADAIIWALQKLPWERTRQLLGRSFKAALKSPGVVIQDDDRLLGVAALLDTDEPDEEECDRLNRECHRVVDTYTRLYSLGERNEDTLVQLTSALAQTILNPRVNPTTRLWMSTMPVIGAAISACHLRDGPDAQKFLARTSYTAMFVMLPPGKLKDNPRAEAQERRDIVDRLICDIYDQLAAYMSVWVRPWKQTSSF